MRSLNDKVDNVVWVRVLNPTLEHAKNYKNARIARGENSEKNSGLQQSNPDNNTKSRDKFDFEMQVNASSVRLPCEEMTRLRSLCTKYDIIFSRSSKEMGFYNRIYHKIKLEKDALPFRRTCGSMSFEKREATKKKC